MKLNKKEAEKITKLYDLGKLKKFKLNPYGAVNYNFEFNTSKGDFMIRFLGHKMTQWKKNKLDLEFRLLNFLTDKKFPYKIPQPIKNKRGRFLFRLNKNYLWVYKKIPGEVNWNFINVKEVAKALGTLHKYLKKFKLPPNQMYYDSSWLVFRYLEIRERISKLKKKNKVDKVVEENLNLFESALKKVIKMENKKHLMLTHSDFGAHNLLFREGKIIGILDFDNIGVNPRIKEVSYPIKRLCFKDNKLNKKKMNSFLVEYEKTIKLTKKEKEMILPMMVLDGCNVFWWVYMAMKKNPQKRLYFLERSINKTKYLLKELSWFENN